MGGREESADNLLHPALARDPAFSHIFLHISTVPELLAKTPFLQLKCEMEKQSFAVLYYLIIHYFGLDFQIICKIILIASHIEILPSTVKLVNDYDTSKY